MKKLTLFILAAVMVFACAAPALAATPALTAKDPVLTLKVVVQDTSTSNDMRNVTFLAQLSNVPPVTSSNRPITIDFYTGSPLLTVYPNQYLGSATLNKDGTAQLKVYQAPGDYAGGAIWVRTAQGKAYSNVVFYKVPPAKPELTLKVVAEAPSAEITADAAAAGNVTYVATLRNAGNAEPIYIDFYTGNPYDGAFPSKYLGTARVDKNGVAQLKVCQKPGKYSGGAIWAKGDVAGVQSNVVIYKVPPIKPQLELEVSAQAAPAPTSNSDAALPQNVTYKVTLRPVQAGKVRFYTGSSNARFPGRYLGSAELERSGTASLSFYQAPGKYSGGAIYIVTDSGKKLYSNVVSYKVPAITEVPNDAVAEKDVRASETVAPVITPLPGIKTISGNLTANSK
ncbi:MAG: hypothetical protein AAGU74_00535 [Bacillota bacterium]